MYGWRKYRGGNIVCIVITTICYCYPRGGRLALLCFLVGLPVRGVRCGHASAFLLYLVVPFFAEQPFFCVLVFLFLFYFWISGLCQNKNTKMKRQHRHPKTWTRKNKTQQNKTTTKQKLAAALKRNRTRAARTNSRNLLEPADRAGPPWDWQTIPEARHALTARASRGQEA